MVWVTCPLGRTSVISYVSKILKKRFYCISGGILSIIKLLQIYNIKEKNRLWLWLIHSPAKVKLYTNVFHQPHNTINIKAELCFHRRKTPLFESYITQSWGISSAAALEDGEAMFLRRRKQLLINQDHIHRM